MQALAGRVKQHYDQIGGYSRSADAESVSFWSRDQNPDTFGILSQALRFELESAATTSHIEVKSAAKDGGAIPSKRNPIADDSTFGLQDRFLPDTLQD